MEDASELSLEASVMTQQAEVKRSVDGLIPQVDPVDDSRHDEIMARVRALQEKAGYDGNYAAWIQKHTPVRLETIVGH